MGKQQKQWPTLLLGGSKITADCDCSHEMKRHLLLGRKVMTNLSSVQWLSHVRLCNPMDCSTPGFPVHHQLPEPAQTHVHHVGDVRDDKIGCMENSIQSSSVQFSRSVLSDSLQPHGLQHTRLPSPSPTPEACSNSCSSSW